MKEELLCFFMKSIAKSAFDIDVGYGDNDGKIDALSYLTDEETAVRERAALSLNVFRFLNSKAQF